MLRGTRRRTRPRQQPTRPHSGGGGGGAPEWLPDGAFAYADFANGHYWLDGSEVAATDIFGTSTYYSFNPANIVAGIGLTAPIEDYATAAVIGAALAQIIAGAVVVLSRSVGSGGALGLDLYDNDFTTDHGVSCSGGLQPLLLSDINGEPPHVLENVPNIVKVAALFDTNLLIAASANGEAAVSINNPATPVPPTDFGLRVGGSAVPETADTFTIYPLTAKGLSDLPALSTLG